MEPKEWYRQKLAEIEDNPSYLCEKKLLKTQELVIEQAKRIEELERGLKELRSDFRLECAGHAQCQKEVASLREALERCGKTND